MSASLVGSEMCIRDSPLLLLRLVLGDGKRVVLDQHPHAHLDVLLVHPQIEGVQGINAEAQHRNAQLVRVCSRIEQRVPVPRLCLPSRTPKEDLLGPAGQRVEEADVGKGG
eukprot:7228439-Alexandrium_andersonii.AAC.1